MVLHLVVHMKNDRNSLKQKSERFRNRKGQESWREKFKPRLLSRLCAAGKSQREAGANIRLFCFWNVTEMVGHSLTDPMSEKE